MEFYVDNKLIIKLPLLVEAHCMDGTENYDGMYFIVCVLSHNDVLREFIVNYATREERNAAFVKLGLAIRANSGSFSDCKT